MSDHPDERLGRYPDLLDEREQAEIEQHLAACSRCRAEVARLQEVRKAADDLGRTSVEPSAELDRRALGRIRAEARLHTARPLWWKAAVVAAPVALAACVVLAVVLRTPDDGVPGEIDWTVKGAGEATGDATLQVALVQGRLAVPLAQGERVPGGSTLLLGGAVPTGRSATVYLIAGERRTVVWEGIGDEETARGSALTTGEAPAKVTAPDEGAFQLEIWLDTEPAAPADRFGLVADPGE